jgi:hypothetical protein
MISQERGDEGINVYFLFFITLLFKGVDQLCELLRGEARRFLIPHELLKTTPSLVGWFAHSLIQSFNGSFVHSIHSFIHSILTYHSFILPHRCLRLGKGK